MKSSDFILLNLRYKLFTLFFSVILIFNSLTLQVDYWLNSKNKNSLSPDVRERVAILKQSVGEVQQAVFTRRGSHFKDTVYRSCNNSFSLTWENISFRKRECVVRPQHTVVSWKRLYLRSNRLSLSWCFQQCYRFICYRLLSFSLLQVHTSPKVQKSEKLQHCSKKKLARGPMEKSQQFSHFTKSESTVAFKKQHLRLLSKGCSAVKRNASASFNF